jgi:hypothetical protein
MPALNSLPPQPRRISTCSVARSKKHTVDSIASRRELSSNVEWLRTGRD